MASARKGVKAMEKEVVVKAAPEETKPEVEDISVAASVKQEQVAEEATVAAEPDAAAENDAPSEDVGDVQNGAVAEDDSLVIVDAEANGTAEPAQAKVEDVADVEEEAEEEEEKVVESDVPAVDDTAAPITEGVPKAEPAAETQEEAAVTSEEPAKDSAPAVVLEESSTAEPTEALLEETVAPAEPVAAEEAAATKVEPPAPVTEIEEDVEVQSEAGLEVETILNSQLEQGNLIDLSGSSGAAAVEPKPLSLEISESEAIPEPLEAADLEVVPAVDLAAPIEPEPAPMPAKPETLPVEEPVPDLVDDIQPAKDMIPDNQEIATPYDPLVQNSGLQDVSLSASMDPTTSPDEYTTINGLTETDTETSCLERQGATTAVYESEVPIVVSHTPSPPPAAAANKKQEGIGCFRALRALGCTIL